MIIQYIGSAAIAGVVAIVTLLLNRKWASDDKKSGKEECVLREIQALREQITSVQTALDSHSAEDMRREAIQCRTRFLRFNDELLLGIKHTKEHFDQILTSDISFYEKYSEEHPEFPNGVAVAAIENIKGAYTKCMQEHKFLPYDKEDLVMAEKKNVFIENKRAVILEGLGINDSDGKRDDWFTAMDKYEAAHKALFANYRPEEINAMKYEFLRSVKGKSFNEFGDEKA